MQVRMRISKTGPTVRDVIFMSFVPVQLRLLRRGAVHVRPCFRVK